MVIFRSYVTVYQRVAWTIDIPLFSRTHDPLLSFVCISLTYDVIMYIMYVYVISHHVSVWNNSKQNVKNMSIHNM